MEYILESEEKSADKSVERPDLSAKLERLKKGLVSDTIRVNAPRFPSLKDSQSNYGQKSGRFGAYDPLRRRNKKFRSAVTRFAPPYYFWHKEFINSMKLKPLLEADVSKIEEPEDLCAEQVSCLWCYQSIKTNDYIYHKTKKCKRRHEFLGNGYYQCTSCKEGFLSEEEAKRHIALHFPNQAFNCVEGMPSTQTSQNSSKNFSIICRDQAKRRKWL